jgi:pimeloyl-ACP methyl ester carboxylesterase
MHGIGHRWQMWTPVIGRLSEHFEVIALDLPGFGRSARLDPVPGLKEAVEALGVFMDELGIPKAHLVGNSLGGWLALELAKQGRALSVCGLAPAGLWVDVHRAERRMGFWFALWLGGARRGQRLVSLLRFRVIRTLTMFGLFGRPWKIPPQVAIDDAHNMVASAFVETMAAGRGQSFRDGQSIDVPVTIAWCGLDPLFNARFCTVRELPSQTQVVHLARCGHVPTWDDPEQVCAVIDATVNRA